MQLDKGTIKKILLIITFGVGLYWLLNHLELAQSVLATVWGLVFPFFLGLVIAFLLNLPMRFLERVIFRGKAPKVRRPLSLLLAIVLVLAVLAFVVFLVGPQLVNTIKQLVANMPGYLQNLQDMLAPYQKYLPELQKFLTDINLDWEKLVSNLVGFLQRGAGSFVSSAWNVAYSIVSGTASFFIGVVFAVYVLLAKEKLAHQATSILQAYLPEKYSGKILRLASLTHRTFSQFVAGQCTESVVLGTLFCLLLWLFRFEYALLIGVLIGFLSLIPVFGATIACIIGALLLLMAQGLWPAIMFVVLFLVVQQIDGNFIYPQIVGNSVGLPAIWVMVAVLIGGSLMGITGMMFFIPLTSVLYTLLRQNTKARLVQKGLLAQAEQLDMADAEKPPRKPWFKRSAKASAGAKTTPSQNKKPPQKPQHGKKGTPKKK